MSLCDLSLFYNSSDFQIILVLICSQTDDRYAFEIFRDEERVITPIVPLNIYMSQPSCPSTSTKVDEPSPPLQADRENVIDVLSSPVVSAPAATMMLPREFQGMCSFRGCPNRVLTRINFTFCPFKWPLYSYDLSSG